MSENQLKSKPLVEPCPDCNSNQVAILDVNQSFQRFRLSGLCGVLCVKCGFVIAKRFPERWPEDTPDHAETLADKIAWLEGKILDDSIRKWNNSSIIARLFNSMKEKDKF